MFRGPVKALVTRYALPRDETFLIWIILFFFDTAIIHQQLVAVLRGPTKFLCKFFLKWTILPLWMADLIDNYAKDGGPREV